MSEMTEDERRKIIKDATDGLKALGDKMTFVLVVIEQHPVLPGFSDVSIVSTMDKDKAPTLLHEAAEGLEVANFIGRMGGGPKKEEPKKPKKKEAKNG